VRRPCRACHQTVQQRPYRRHIFNSTIDPADSTSLISAQAGYLAGSRQTIALPESSFLHVTAAAGQAQPVRTWMIPLHTSQSFTLISKGGLPPNRSRRGTSALLQAWRGSDECSTEQHLFAVAAHSSRYRCLLSQGPGVAFQCRSCFSVPQSRLPRQLAAKSRLPYLSAPRTAHRHRLAVTPHLSSPSSRPARDARHVHDTSPITCAADLHQLPLLNLTRLPRPRSSPLLKPWRQAWT
jgi:hypothetical protein